MAVIGGGAAGIFAAATAARLLGAEGKVVVFERGAAPLQKVRISGGGRCNVTHSCFDPAELCTNYPRGARQLRGAFHRFAPGDTVQWFESRGVRLKTEADGRMFPVTDCSQTIIDCLLAELRRHGGQLKTKTGVRSVEPCGDAWLLSPSHGEPERFDKVLVATGGIRGGSWIERLGHPIAPPVPSLFTFHVAPGSTLDGLAGISVAEATASLSFATATLPDSSTQSTGPLLITHHGLSGPCILRLSAMRARELHEVSYRFPLQIRWISHWNEQTIRDWIRQMREDHPAKKPVNTPPPDLPARLWAALLGSLTDLPENVRWTNLPKTTAGKIVSLLTRFEVSVVGKSPNKDEFVTCGGVRCEEVDFRTMQSRLHPGLFFAGEVLNIDGITGGFNFQSAWTTGWIAGHGLANHPLP